MIVTERLLLRLWQAEDFDSLVLLNQDPEVMHYFPCVLNLAQTRALMDKNNRTLQQEGIGLYACTLKTTGELIGFIGLSQTEFNAHFTPCIAMSWRLASRYWGQSYAFEGAKAVMDHGFKILSLQEIVAYTVPANIRSIRVMQRLGMQYDKQGDFAH